MNSPATGYYSLIQYCPDRMRLEAANIGVLLFCPERNYLRVRLAPSNRRIERFFGAEAGDLKQVMAMKKILEHRLESEATQIKDVEGLERFADLLANEIVITPPRMTLVEEPEVELAQLFDELVGRFIRTEPAPEKRLVEKLRLTLETPRLQSVLKRDVTVKVPVVGTELTLPYAYQNGTFNLIEPLELNQKSQPEVFRQVLTKAAQGRLIYTHDDAVAGKRRLVIVAAFGPVAESFRDEVAEVMHDHDVSFYPESALADLESSIAKSAH